MRLYISGPMTGIPEHNFPAFNDAAAVLAGVGYEVENPAAKGIQPGWTWDDYLRYDIRKLMDCQGVATLPGWDKSVGANLEVDIARRIHMPVLAVDLWLTDVGLSIERAAIQ